MLIPLIVMGLILLALGAAVFRSRRRAALGTARGASLRRLSREWGLTPGPRRWERPAAIRGRLRRSIPERLRRAEMDGMDGAIGEGWRR